MSSGSHLAPHWLPQHATNFSNLNESGYADDDSAEDSDDENVLSDHRYQINMNLTVNKELTPPLSDADNPISPYYDDTPLMMMNNRQKTTPTTTTTTTSAFDVISPHVSPHAHGQNSLNMGPILDELEKEQFQLVIPADNENENENGNEDEDDLEEYSQSTTGTATPMDMDRASLLRSIPEWEDTDDETSANDTDAATAYEHMRNLSTHIEDHAFMDGSYSDSFDQFSDSNQSNSHSYKLNIKSPLIRISSNKSEPGHTPPPVSPRYMKMSKAHKRKLSDKLEQLLSDRQNASDLVAKQILFSAPHEDVEKMKKSLAHKREQRDKIRQNLKRKLSHDFRPSERDILERGIKIIPNCIRSDEEDADEEVIVYDDDDNRESFSLQKKKHLYDAEERDFADMLKQKRQRNSKKILLALIDRPSPSDIIAKGIISADNVNNAIPTISKYEMLRRLEAEYNLKRAENEEKKMQNEKKMFRKKRRIRILNFYDNYLFNTQMYGDDDDDGDGDGDDNVEEEFVDIDADYLQILDKVRNGQSDLELDLNAIKDEEISLEKEWLRNLRKRKFRSYISKNRRRAKRTKREQMEIDLGELQEQMDIVLNSQKVETMNAEVLRMEKQHVLLIENTAKQIDSLRGIIKNLNRCYAHRTGFVAVS